MTTSAFFKKYNHTFLDKFKRITSNGLYIAEIDGLRFFAILLVVFYHIHGYYAIKFADTFHTPELLALFLEHSKRGVELFFVISGFILCYPFALHYLTDTKKPSLGPFYERRVTRLEPPYIIAITVFYIILSLQKDSFSYLLPNYIFSLLYLHNIVYNSYSDIISVAWSLEIEVQFYILAPFFCYIFKLPKYTRRTILLLSIILFPCLTSFFNIYTISLINYIQYFLVGYLLADIYICKDLTIKNKVIAFMAIPCCIFMIFIDLKSSINLILFPLLIFIFYITVLTNTTFKKVFSRKIVVVIGAMCYSIYLIHYPLISFLGKLLSRLPLLPLPIYYIIIATAILICSSFFYLYIEKPFMDKNWPKKLVAKFTNPNQPQKIID